MADCKARVPVGIAYSGGTSSKWMVHAVARGVIPRPEHLVVLHAMTGIEHSWTDDDVAEVEEFCRKEGIPFIRCQRDEQLAEHLLSIESRGLTRAETPPMYVAKDGGGRGQIQARCTREFKVLPMRRAATEWLRKSGLPSGGKSKRMEKWIGFGADEPGRALKSEAKQDVLWETMDFPAIRLGVSRAEQRAQLESWGVKAPRFSMCTICPWKTPGRWAATPEGQRGRVIEVDEAVRDLSALGITDGEVFLSDRLVPISALFKKHRPVAPTEERIMDAGCDGGHCFL